MGRMSDLYTRIQEGIANRGQYLIGVFDPDGNNTPFIYTIGNHLQGFPELLLIGGAGPDVGTLVNELGEIMRKRGKPFCNGELVSLGGKFPVKVINAGPVAKTDYTLQAGHYLRTDGYWVQQVLLCDLMGRFPDDPECDRKFAVPVLDEWKVMGTGHGGHA